MEDKNELAGKKRKRTLRSVANALGHAGECIASAFPDARNGVADSVRHATNTFADSVGNAPKDACARIRLGSERDKRTVGYGRWQNSEQSTRFFALIG